MKDAIATLLASALRALAGELIPGEAIPAQIPLERTRDSTHGDFASNVALLLAKPARRSPRELAERIVAALPADPRIARVEVAGPGFINFHLAPSAHSEILAKVLPSAKIARIDADAMRKKHALRDLLNAFQARKIDVLIGTQMIAKGLHFPNVTLVGILNADIGLHVPDFRAGERVFQLLTQVAGRAGRGELEGEVIVQTFTPHSPSIQFARHHDFDGFVEGLFERF